jgi:hypothetical protein
VINDQFCEDLVKGKRWGERLRRKLGDETIDALFHHNLRLAAVYQQAIFPSWFKTFNLWVSVSGIRKRAFKSWQRRRNQTQWRFLAVRSEHRSDSLDRQFYLKIDKTFPCWFLSVIILSITLMILKISSTICIVLI